MTHVIVTPTMSISTWMAGPACAASMPILCSVIGSIAPTTVEMATMHKTDAPGCDEAQLQDAHGAIWQAGVRRAGGGARCCGGAGRTYCHR